jgi:uncharacterized protein (DUF169 family)
MPDYAQIEQQLTEALALTRRPVAIAFLDVPPPGVERFTGTLPSGCSFWSLAAQGRTFSTSPADHHNCPIGSYTHNIPLPPAREPELMQTLSLMAEIGYIRMEEVAGIPRVPASPGTVIYAPLGETPMAPDAVLVSGPPGRLMLLHEAATRSGVPMQPLFGRPTCMAIPAAMGNAMVSSYGCIGNRVYTGLPDSDMYTTVAGSQIAAVADQLATITSANAVLTDYHTQRRESLTT